MTRVLPVAGRAVYLPNTRPPLPVPAEGVDVVLDAFWLRRLRDGDVRLATTGAQTGGTTTGGTTTSGGTTVPPNGTTAGGGTTTSGGTGGSAQGVDQTARTAAAAAQAKADAAIPASAKGVAGGVATLGQDGRVPAGQLPPAAAGVEGGAAPGDLPAAVSASGLVGVASDGSLVRVPPPLEGEVPDALPSVTTAPELVGIDLDGDLVRLITPSLVGPVASLPAASALDGTELVPVNQGGTWKRATLAAVRATGTGGQSTPSGTAPSVPAAAPALSFVSATASGITLRLGTVSGADGIRLEFKRSTDTAWRTVTPERAPGDVPLSSLDAGTSYDFRATAYNGVGDGPTSAVVTRGTTGTVSSNQPPATPAGADPLDGYTSTWLGLYSVARRLRSAYTGPLVRVKHASTYAETDIGAGTDGLLDRTALSAAAGGGTLHTVRLYDHSGLGHHADLFSNGGQGPVLVQDGVLVTGPGTQGRPGMLFDLAQRHGLKTAATLPAMGTKLLMAVSVQVTSGADAGAFRDVAQLDPAAGSAAGSGGYIAYNDDRLYGDHGGVAFFTGAAGSGKDVAAVVSAEFDGATGAAYLNATGAPNNGAAVTRGFGGAGGRIVIGNNPGNPEFWTGISGAISEVVFASVPAAGERAGLSANMRAFQGIA